jgi:phosphatidylserine/phosphatidylglycerophosphate/cardiolipin synthase-like enzyme
MLSKKFTISTAVMVFAASLSVQAWQLPQAGSCTPNDEFCASFAPSDMPLHDVARALKSAKKSIRIAIYNMDALEFADILKERLDQGVSVEFLVDYKLSASSNIVFRSLGEHRGLKRLRIPVLRGANPQMHNKIIIVDGEKLLFGSANFTYSGLVANYENVMSTTNPLMIKKFSEELDELKNVAEISCKIFTQDPSKCGTAQEKWDSSFHTIASTGKLAASVLKEGCTPDEFRGFLDPRNQLLKGFRGGKDLKDCLSDDRYLKLAEQLGSVEKYADGSRVRDVRAYRPDYNPLSGEKIRVLFSPEDPVEAAIVKELELTLKNPSESFAYLSVNFITNKSIAATLLKLHEAGVRMRIFLDKGRVEDPMFQSQMPTLSKLGIGGGESGISKNAITVFTNELTGPYGCNHNKMGVVYSPQGGLRLLNGSANWSGGAMNNNDENFTVVQDDALASIYLKEIVSQLYTYRYMQQEQNPGFVDDVKVLTSKAPCLGALLGKTKSCKVNGKDWFPETYANVALSLEGVPADARTDSVWVRVANARGNGVSLPLFTHEVFNGRWLVAVPVPLGETLQFKFYKSARRYFAKLINLGLPNESWEYGGIGNDRTVVAPNLSVQAIKGRYTWGKP